MSQNKSMIQLKLDNEVNMNHYMYLISNQRPIIFNFKLLNINVEPHGLKVLNQVHIRTSSTLLFLN